MHPKYETLLDPVYLAYAKMVELSAAESSHLSLAEKRHQHHQSILPLRHSDIVSTHDLSVQARDSHTIALRFFHNKLFKDSKNLTIYLHGGGWVFGGLDSHHDICLSIAEQTHAHVIAVDYRLAPENPFPTPMNDCIDAINHIITNKQIPLLPEIKSFVLAGDSAGANLCVSSLLSDQIIPTKLKGQALFYAGLGASINSSSFSEHAEAPVISTQLSEEFFLLYLGHNIELISELTSPLLAKDLSMMPATCLYAAENDPLRDDSLHFYENLIHQNIKVNLRIDKTLGHGYLRVHHEQTSSANAALQHCCKSIMVMHS